VTFNLLPAVVLAHLLGGWTSANYAALGCTELSICQGAWYDRIDFARAFSIPVAEKYEFGAHDNAECMTIHRIGALITFLYLCWLGFRLHAAAHSSLIKKLAVLLVMVLGAQIILGVSNVVFSLPIAVAVMHNAVAACLMLMLVTINYTLYRKT
jgi:cytochrome c oxidase assembly protein subunit 15